MYTIENRPSRRRVAALGRLRRPDAVLLVQLVAVRLHHVDEIREAFLLLHLQRLEMLENHVGQLRFVHARPRGHLVVALVAAQRVHLQLVQIDVRHVRVGFVAVVFAVLAAALRAGALDARFVEVADVDVRCLRRGNGGDGLKWGIFGRKQLHYV